MEFRNLKSVDIKFTGQAKRNTMENFQMLLAYIHTLETRIAKLEHNL